MLIQSTVREMIYQMMLLLTLSVIFISIWVSTNGSDEWTNEGTINKSMIESSTMLIAPQSQPQPATCIIASNTSTAVCYVTIDVTVIGLSGNQVFRGQNDDNGWRRVCSACTRNNDNDQCVMVSNARQTSLHFTLVRFVLLFIWPMTNWLLFSYHFCEH